MRLSRICRYSTLLLILCLLLSVFTGCSKGKSEDPAPTETDSMQTEEMEEQSGLAEIETKYGSLFIPQKFADTMDAKITANREDACKVVFSATKEKKSYDLFKICIGEESGQLVGTLTDENGIEHNVYASVFDLGSMENLSTDEQDQLYAMQEAVNVVAENLK